ncbi:hypothetical protein QVD17_40858 [Tagetes erecta]|uniref:Uncharacterized protein n=1 Tax=Tagetes erecta TaxID=13708 RepID=A0AAD8JQJ0_TARER|nr:hypothetical protein QVD17_40858 [Tagetes erecta]
MPPKRKRTGLGNVGGNDFEASSSSSRQLLCRASRVRSSVRGQVVGVGVSAGVESVAGGFSSVSSVYLDLGSCTEICQHCGAAFWFVERLKSVPLSVAPKYTGCCRNGKAGFCSF